MGTIYNKWTLGANFRSALPQSFQDVGSQMRQLERHLNGMPFLSLENTPLPAQQSVTTNATMGDVTDFNAVVSPTRLGQLIVVLIQVQASRAVGVAQCQGRVTVSVGGATPVVLPGGWYLSAAFDSKLHLVPYVANSTREHVFQVQMTNTGGATTWLIRSPESSITVLTV